MYKRVVFVLLALTVVALLSPANAWWIQWYALVENQLFDLLLDSSRIIGISLVLAGLLAPFEALGWWAGWYGGKGNKTNLSFKHIQATLDQAEQVSVFPHYIVYLDGIGKSSFKYSFQGARFLQKLRESLPSDRILIDNIMPYSVINLPLTLNRPLARLWQWIEHTAKFEFLVLLRNMFQVAVSVDSRYGPIYNRGTAEIIIDRLLTNGYRPGSGALITLIGYSGGGQISLGAMPYIKRVLAAPIEVISLAGVISGNNEVVQVEHLYHLVGEQDRVAYFTPLLFPRRWSMITWSNWNLAKSRGEISFISLGKVKHDSKNGPLDENALLPDGRNHLAQTIEIILRILTRVDGYEPYPAAAVDYTAKSARIVSDYENYVQAKFNQPDFYPIDQSLAANYLPVAQWIGRLILPEVTERSQVEGVYLEVHHAPEQDLIGKKVYLRWRDRPDLQAYVNQVKTRIDFSAQAYKSIHQGIVHPTRLNHWRQVQALESLAGARPNDDVMVALTAVEVIREPDLVLSIDREPILITGKYYALVSFTEVFPNHCGVVRHYNPDSGKFDGKEEVVYLPQVVPDRNGVISATANKITESPLNQTGWYIYGAKNHQGMFTVQAIAPRALFQLQPAKIIAGLQKTTDYIHNRYWQGVKQKKGQIDSILLNPRNLSDSELINSYQEGDRLLVLHTYGGIGGKKAEFAPLGLFFGHFSFGLARVVREPLTQELRFKLAYGQVYTQNTTGIIAGSLDWTNFVGDRQFGWLGSRPITDIVVKLDLLEEYNFDGLRRFPLNALAYQLDRMMARYRTGDGTGATFVGPANSCVQDSCQALYQAIKLTLSEIEHNPQIKAWISANPKHPQTQRLERLVALNKTIEDQLITWQTREDWVDPFQSLIGTRLADSPVSTVVNALTSWRSLLPRLANDRLAEIFLSYGASLWLLQTYQVGGWDEDIEPIAPTKLWI
jgi:predicted Abi (CAAX) family protease